MEIKPGVRAVVLSWVQFATGVVAPLATISEACRRVGAWLIVDAIQGLGAIPFSLKSSGVDIVCGGSHKWLCGMIGMGFIGFREDLYLEMKSVLQGALTYGTPDDPVVFSKRPILAAKRFEPGAPAIIPVIATAASIQEIMKIGSQEICKANLSLSKILIAELEKLGLEILGRKLDNLDSSIITFKAKDSVTELSLWLQKNKVAHAIRAGGIRISPHGFNHEADIERLISLIKSGA